MIHWHKSDIGNRAYCVLPDGKKKSMPRYYRDKIYTPEELGFLKGEHEKRFREKDLENAIAGNVQTWSDRKAAVDAAFSLMKMDDLIIQKL